MHAALEAVRTATEGSPFEGRLWVVGGAVRDELLGLPIPTDFDLVTLMDAGELAKKLHAEGLSSIAPVTYERFGTAMVQVAGTAIEIVTARRESYDAHSRKPHVQPATLGEDALRRDFTCNTLLRNLHTRELVDPLGCGLEDLRSRRLRTPLDPEATFQDDPLRMLRAVRFRWQLGFDPSPELYPAVLATSGRLEIVSAERVRDELVKMLLLPDADRALADLMELRMLHGFAPELVEMVGVEQGDYHHLDVWEHSLLVVRNVGRGDPILTWAALLHDVGKPRTRRIDDQGRTRFFGHEAVGAEMTSELLRRLKFSNREVEQVAALVKNHMRLGTAPSFTPAAARRLIRDLGDLVPRLLDLVEADASALKPGVRKLDLASVRKRIREAVASSPRESLESPLSGAEIMAALGLSAGPEVGKWKAVLAEKVIEGEIPPGDREAALRVLRAIEGRNSDSE
jgi:poly(A) polymerase